MLEINTDNFKALVNVIKQNKRHHDYKTVTELANLYRMMITGKDDDEIYQMFYKKFAESSDKTEQALYEQLKRISNLILKPVTARISQPFNKVPRSNARVEVLEYSGDEQGTKLNELQTVLDKFYGSQSFNDWMNTRFMELSRIDPNSWVVIEFPETDGSILTEPYPFEVKSKDAIYFEFINNLLQFLVVMDVETENNINYNSYTLYGQNSVIKLSHVDKSKVKGLKEQKETIYVENRPIEITHYYIHDVEIFELKQFEDLEGTTFVMVNEGQFYLFQEPTPHNLGYVNAFRVGYIRDDYTDGRTFVNYFDVALPYLLSTVKVTCEKDLAFALHLFGRRYQYEQPCLAEGCNKGHLAEGGVCSSCHGTGTLVTSSTMEVVTIPLPNNAMSGDILDLSKMAYVDRPPTDIIELQLKYLDELVANCFGVIFNSDSFIKPTIADTATAVLDDKENSYDALYPFATNFAKIWNYGVKTIAKIVGKDSKLLVKLSFGKDFGFETRTELMQRYDVAKKAGMSQDVLSKIEAKIIKIDNQDNSDEYVKWSVKKMFDPFYGKSPEEVMVLMAGTDIPKKTKVLYANYGMIWDELEMQYPDIYKMNKSKMKELLDIKVQKYVELIEAEKPKTTPFKIGALEDEE